jgi:hypothetical protein
MGKGRYQIPFGQYAFYNAMSSYHRAGMVVSAHNRNNIHQSILCRGKRTHGSH